MSDRTSIEWTDATWNPIKARNRATGQVGWGCEKVSPACTHCYAEAMNRRLGTGQPYSAAGTVNVEYFLDRRVLEQPVNWKKPRKIFVCSMTDLFGPFVERAWIAAVQKYAGYLAKLVPELDWGVAEQIADAVLDNWASKGKEAREAIRKALRGMAGVRRAGKIEVSPAAYFTTAAVRNLAKIKIRVFPEDGKGKTGKEHRQA